MRLLVKAGAEAVDEFASVPFVPINLSCNLKKRLAEAYVYFYRSSNYGFEGLCSFSPFINHVGGTP
jgi:hypothetical protein